MTTLTQLTTRRYLPDGSPKPHWIATGGRRPKRQSALIDIVFRDGYITTSSCHMYQIGWRFNSAVSDIIAIRWLKKE